MRLEPAADRGVGGDAWERYRDNPARHLIGISRDLQSRVMHSLSEDCGFGGLRPSLGPLLSRVWDEPRPLAAIADELAISRQACSQLANRAESAGYLERRPSPADRRSKVAALTRRGRALVEQGVRTILAGESEYAALVGRLPYRRFTAALAQLYRGLGLPTHPDPSLTDRASQSVGVLPIIAVRVQQQLMEATIARGHRGLKMSHGQVLPLIGPGGARVRELARIQRVSRQAISATARDLESLGYLRRRPDPRDRRGAVLVLTRRGASLLRDSVEALDGLERSFRSILGRERLADLKRVARDLYRALHLESEIFEAGPEPDPAPGATAARGAATGDRDIQRLATRLRRRLGSGDAARLAALLEPGARETAT